ncbi:MAG: nucleotidyltransferase family protein [Chthonomonadaceae bacterium]|nr:nucleotidyltransferase family protein [Chthonomonadaceae bacterium]
MTDLTGLVVTPEQPLIEAMRSLNANAKGIVLLLDDKGHLLATVTDGDLRRAILAGLPLETTLGDWLALQIDRSSPLTMLAESSTDEIRSALVSKNIRHMPLVDDTGRVVRVVIENELLVPGSGDVHALVMAGGEGKRLWPLTENTPKPLLNVGDTAVIERIVSQIAQAGVASVAVSTCYRADMIEDALQDGSQFGVSINYVREEQPLGTAGALGLMKPWKGTLVMVNGDVLTEVRYEKMLGYHKESGAIATVGVRPHRIDVPFGVVELDDDKIVAIKEKPSYHFFVNAGVYLLEDAVRSHLSEGKRLDMPDLIEALLLSGERVNAFPIVEQWIDIGSPADYERAKQHYG